MPQFQNRAQQAVSEELEEFSQYGPFGGIQSEVPLDLVEQYGVIDINNMILRLSTATVRPGIVPLPPLPAPTNEPILGIADFFNANGVRIQVIMTPTRLIQWVYGTQTWDVITKSDGTGSMTGGPEDIFTWTVVNNKLCFCQGVDPVQAWDGISASFAAVSVNAVPARYLFELGTHLIACYTIEGGTTYAQRVRWTGAGDPTDWTSFDSGVQDNLGDLGPIQNGVRIFQTGYIFSQWGITQMIPTGQAAAPFQFVPVTTRARGNTVPYSLVPSGEEFACYIGKDNVYTFNGTNSNPMASIPTQGNRRTGARKRIFIDLTNVKQPTVTAYVSDNINCVNYDAYWLVIPNNDVWLYHFDEVSWTRFTFSDTITQIGRFFRNQFIRIEDLSGTIAQQSWIFDMLATQNPYDMVALGCVDGVINVLDFTTYSELPWFIQGVWVFGDPRHTKTIKKVRVTTADNGAASYNLTLTNQQGFTVTIPATQGSGSGNNVSQVLTIPNGGINGIRFKWSLSGAPGVPFSLVEIAPMWSTGGEQRGGTVDA